MRSSHRWLCLGVLVSAVAGGLSGCTPPAPATYAVSLTDVAVEPAAVTAETPVTLTFKVLCNRTGASQLPEAEVVAEARRSGSQAVVTQRVKCAARAGQHYSAMPWEGAGRMELGKLPAWKQVITLALQPKGAAWTMPPAQAVTIEVKQAEK